MSDDLEDIRASLDKLATAASAQGRQKIAAVCLLALAKIDELEGVIAAHHAGQRLGGAKSGVTRLERLTPERRKEIATTAANRRWHNRRRAS